MKYLFEYIPPVRSDVLGFYDVILRSKAYGLVNDSWPYHFGAEFGGLHSGRSYNSCVSDLRENDVISGAEETLLRCARDIAVSRPEYSLVGEGPAASMIGTDLEDICKKIGSETSIKAVPVNVNGQKSYDVGVSETLKTFARLEAVQGEKQPGCINILGGSQFDIGIENIQAIRNWCADAGFTVLNKDPDNCFRDAAKAELNLVITQSGLAAARLLNERFGTPYFAGLPFGSAVSKILLDRITTCKDRSISPTDGKSALIFAEPFIGSAIRDTLCIEYGFGHAALAGFQSMGSSTELRREKDVFELFESRSYDYIIGDPAFKACWNGKGKWIDLPYKAFYVPTAAMPGLVGSRLNKWLERSL